MIEALAGQHISDFADQLAREAQASGATRGVFNGVEIVVDTPAHGGGK